ncbi:MAG: hypothetical protein A2128_01225 [Candidatus Liptonbacteria bacterium GWC1_60_9]|uniref:DUF5667 domain-containing protein n=2 Tax=Candidatus Liptoniibacteriota TaxID=1817909 RepID=A0A1G2CQC2_9BACT|nr:MAG: hypothetical protein UZ00_C0002G0034 [Parcubacteria group bacterium GW2011_GWA1_60_11]OGY96763.1 MAG: hypothetical protein A2128_01225 [Candidatus Liptonbacteria bacterium GWC1_60_9]OGZ02841.1 MAG: hypothetical protein A3G64_00665 [Candidatus Liptonbacteria bacterium RIFCSPLOWO2_12_FULL_60_15]
MQKTTFAGGCVAAAVMFSIVLAPAAMAQGSGGVTTAELGVERPGLLPTNPFYFMKEWARGVRRTFTTGAVNKAEYELQVATEKAAELKRLEEVKSDARAIARAAENYAENMQRLTERLKTLSATSENPKVDKLMDSLVERTLVHQQLLGELKAKYGEVKDDIEAVQKTVDEVLKEVPRTIDSAEQFTDRLKEAIDARRESAVKELNAINTLDRLNTNLPNEVQEKLSRLKDDLVLKFQGRVSAAPVSPSALEEFAGDVREKVLVIDEVRERVLDAGLKNSLSQLRDRVLKESEDDKSIGEEDAKRMIQYAEELAQKLAAQIKELGVKAPTSVQQLLERANANIEQAKTFYAAGQFGAAFGQATAAVSAVKNALTQLAVRTQDFEKNILELKQKFDELRAMARKAELSREKHPKIFALFDQAEQAIVSLSTLSSTAPTSEKFVALMRETKALLGTIEAAIREALMPQIPTAKPVQPEPAVVPTVRNFEECAKASNPVLASDSVSASFPRQCKTKDGRVFKEETACIQVIQPAKDPQSGACKEFPTPCDVPLGWTAVNACPVPEAVKGPEASGTPGTGTSVVPSTWTISMGDDGFFPSELKVRRGDKVVWTNKGSRDHWPASAIHPTHELYPEFDAKRGIGPSESYSFVFEKAGTWKYHDHLNSGLTGVIVVVE